VLLCPLFIFFFHYYAHHRDLHSFPTRRSSDLASFEHRVNARTPVDLAVLQEDLLDLGFEPGIFSLVLAHFPLAPGIIAADRNIRSEEHTSELQSQSNLVCRLLLEKKKNTKYEH